MLVGLELISEVRNGHAKRLRIVVSAVARALLRAERAGEVVIGEGNVGAMLRVQSYLEEVREGAAVAVGAARAVGTHGSSVNEMIAGHLLRKGRNGRIAVEGFRAVDGALSTASGGSIGARRQQRAATA